MSVPLIGRLLDRLPNDAWQESLHRRPLPSSDGVARRPVVLLHGAAGSRSNFTGVVSALRDGNTHPPRPVVSISYGHHGTAPLHQNFAEVRAKLAGLIATTGSIDLVGHSQGGLLALAASGTPELREKVGHVVGIAGNFRGIPRPTRVPLWLPLPVPAWQDNIIGSPALRDLMDYAQRSTVVLTQIFSTADRIITPARAHAFLTKDTPSGCSPHQGRSRIVAVDDISHAKLPYSLGVGRLVTEALNS